MARGARLPGEAWSRRDWALQQAVDLLDAARCPGCHQPKWLSHDKATRGKWSVRAERCYSCTASEQRQARFDENTPQRQAIYFGTEYAG